MILKNSLCGKNIVLKTLGEDDVNQEYLNWLNDPLVNKYLEVRINPPKSIEDQIYFVQEQRGSKNSILCGLYTIENHFIGTLRLHDISNYHYFAYVGMMIGNIQFHGKGLGQEALDLISNYSKEILGLNFLYAGCYENNKASLNCFIKSGFKKECVIKDYWSFEDNRISNIILKKELI